MLNPYLSISVLLFLLLNLNALETVYLNANNNKINPIGSYDDPFQSLQQLFLLSSNEQIEVLLQSDILCNSSITNEGNFSFEYLFFKNLIKFN